MRITHDSGLYLEGRRCSLEVDLDWMVVCTERRDDSMDVVLSIGFKCVGVCFMWLVGSVWYLRR